MIFSKKFPDTTIKGIPRTARDLLAVKKLATLLKLERHKNNNKNSALKSKEGCACSGAALKNII